MARFHVLGFSWSIFIMALVALVLGILAAADVFENKYAKKMDQGVATTDSPSFASFSATTLGAGTIEGATGVTLKSGSTSNGIDFQVAGSSEMKITDQTIDIPTNDLSVGGDLSVATDTVTVANPAAGATMNSREATINITAITDSAAGGSEVLTVTNSHVTANSTILAVVSDYGGTYSTNGLPTVTVDNKGAGTFDLVIANAHPSANLSATTLSIDFWVLGDHA